MKANVNPFEPWRPPQAAVPPPLHVGRPWRPPPPPPAHAAEEPLVVEPVDPPPRNKPLRRPSPPKRPQDRTDLPSPRRTPVSQWAAFVVLAVLGFLCLDSVGWLRGTHAPRLMALGASAGIFVGMAVNHRRGWHRRLRGMAIALALAGIALWFVPTLRGVNLWSAYRQIEALRGLPAGAVAEYQRGAAARRTLVEEFPSFAANLRAAEQAWLRRTVDEAINKADRQLDNDPDTALAQLHQLDEQLAPLEHYASVRKELEAARRRMVQACLAEPRP